MIDRNLELRVKVEGENTSTDAAPPFETEWPKSVVPLEALERTLYAMADRATGTIRDAGDVWILELQPKPSAIDAAAMGHLLRQEVNDQSLRVKIAEKTDPLRNLVFAMAFSRSGLVDPTAKR
jgi:His-Xaa-Ser system protein HxsD